MFTRKRKKERISAAPVFSAIANKIIAAQKKWSDWLYHKTKHWNKSQQKIFLLIISLVLGGLSTNCIIQVFKDKKAVKSDSFLSVPPTISPPIIPPDDIPEYFPQDTLIISRFRQAIDSLLQSPDGRKQYDEFIKERPGFMDSLDQAEKLLKQSFNHH